MLVNAFMADAAEHLRSEPNSHSTPARVFCAALIEVVKYICLIAAKYKLDLRAAVRSKFDRTSQAIGYVAESV